MLLPDHSAFSLENVRPGPLDIDLQWQPSAWQILFVTVIHDIAPALVGAGVVSMVAAILFWLGA